MNSQEARFEVLSVDQLDAVSGGRFNNGSLLVKPQNGVPGSGGKNDNLLDDIVEFGIAIGAGLMGGIALGRTVPGPSN
jgi:hypothetical protein